MAQSRWRHEAGQHKAEDGTRPAKVGDTATDWREVIDDSRVSVLPVKDEWCTGRGIPRLTAMVLQVGVIFESNNFCCPFS